MALMNLQDISLAFGGPLLIDNINLQIQPGERICLLGRNGAGKSSFMKIINGDMEPDSGRILADDNIKTTLLTQNVPEDLTGTIYKVIAEGIISLDSFKDNLHTREEQNHRMQIDRIVSIMSLDPEEKFKTLSAGMKRRVLLGRALVNDPDILLLDEPTNHLDIESIKWLEDFLRKFEKTIVFVTHDRAFLQKIATRIIELDRGNISDWKCDYNTFLKRKEAWLESEETRNALFDKRLAQEEIWIRKGIKARRTRNEGRVRALKELRRERENRREVQGSVKMGIQQAERSGKIVIEIENLTFEYPDKKIVENFSTLVQRGDRIGIIGSNGCGKSTLIKLLTEKILPNSGIVKVGTKLEIAYFDQLRNQLDENRTVRENVTDGNDIIDFNGKSKHVIGYLQDFLFTPERTSQKVSVLSGGEKNRLLLAKLFTRTTNFLILDEPTNDLDLETVELLEEILLDYQGTLLLVSHDREFLNNVVTSTFAFEGDGIVREYAGGYDDWIRQRKIEKKEKVQKQERVKLSSKKKKLSFKEKKELDELPGILEVKEKRKDDLFEIMSDPTFYQKSGEKVSEIKDELKSLELELETLFERWNELEEKNQI